jgi:hypothetical protein
MNDLSGTVNLLESAQFAAGKNKVINGDFSINQRNFTSITANAFGFDRWGFTTAGGTGTNSTQAFAVGTALGNYSPTNYCRIVTTGQSAASDLTLLAQRIENVSSQAGQTVTISFYAKAASGTPKIAVELAQGFGTGGSPSAEVDTYAGQVTLSTSWARYSLTVALPSVSGKTLGTANNNWVSLNLWVSAGSTYNSRTGSLGIQSNTFDIWGVQQETASTASPFQTATGTQQGELAACQRYYRRITAGTTLAYFGTGYAYSTGAADIQIPCPVEMRVTPTVIEYSALADFKWESTTSSNTPTAIAFDSNQNSKFAVSVNVTKAAGFTAWAAVNFMANATTNAYLGFGAEL